MNTAKSIISIAILIAFSVMPRILKADSQKLLDSKVLFGFQGKGSSLVYDTAVLQVSYDRIPAVKQQQLVFSANSSGAILAVYFSCHGVNPTTINSVRNWMTGGSGRVQKAVKDFMATGENIIHKFGQLKLGIIPEVPIDNLDPFIEKAVGINHISELNSAKCVPQIPFVIAAANYEVIDNRHPKFSVPFNAIDIRTFKPSEDPRIKFPSLQEKDFNYKNFDVSWKPQTHKKFLEMGETPEGLKKFEAGHRGLKLSESPVIGKACTYFATPELFELLAKMPLDQRLCDLRLVENARDMALAIRASAAEPTFYPVVTEDEPEKLMVGTELGSLGNSTERRYWGGYIMPMVSQDLRRSLPHLTVMGTGWYDVMANIAKLFVALVLVDPNECGKRGEYWADFVATPSEEMKKSIFGARLSIEREFNIGVEVTNQCIDRELNGAKACVPAGAAPSFFDAAPNALSPVQYGVGDPLPRARGIKHLL